MAIEYVRVKDDINGDESTQNAAGSLVGFTVIDKPAVDEGGNPLPPKLNVNRRAANKQAAESPGENPAAESPAEPPTDGPRADPEKE